MTEHAYGTAAVTKAATCTEEGEKSKACKVCGITKIVESVPKLQHQYNSEVTKESTCTVKGTKTFTCATCSHTYTEEIVKIDHTYTSKVTTEATCTDAGVKTYTCKACNDSYIEAVSAKGHSYTTKSNSSATCTSAGSATHTCKACGNSYTETIAAMGHKWVDATCTKAKYCSRCNATSGSALGHTTNNGTCGRCGKTFSVADQCSLVAKSKLLYYVNYYMYDHPQAPYNYFKITNLTYSFAGYSNATVKLSVVFDVEILIAETTNSSFYISIYNADGKMVAHEKVYVKGSSVAGLCTTASTTIFSLQPGSYSIELSSK